MKNLKFFIIFINGGILSLTDSHHNHHGQKPTMVGICHGGSVPVSHDNDSETDDVVNGNGLGHQNPFGLLINKMGQMDLQA